MTLEDFAMFVCYPKIYSHTSLDYIKKHLPTTKKIILKLQEYIEKYPSFGIVVRTNLWRVSNDPVDQLTNHLPLELWQQIDAYIVEDRINQLVSKCKNIIIIDTQTMLDDHIDRYLRTLQFTDYKVHEYWWAKQSIDRAKKLQEQLQAYKKTYYIQN